MKIDPLQNSLLCNIVVGCIECKKAMGSENLLDFFGSILANWNFDIQDLHFMHKSFKYFYLLK
jgi:hypothetical protein